MNEPTINPGEGYMILTDRETLLEPGDEFLNDSKEWVTTYFVGRRVGDFPANVYRRKVKEAGA
jgi:hypothetical protein